MKKILVSIAFIAVVSLMMVSLATAFWPFDKKEVLMGPISEGKCSAQTPCTPDQYGCKKNEDCVSGTYCNKGVIISSGQINEGKQMKVNICRCPKFTNKYWNGSKCLNEKEFNEQKAVKTRAERGIDESFEFHPADVDKDGRVSSSEANDVSKYSTYHCGKNGAYSTGKPFKEVDKNCSNHWADTNNDWRISKDERAEVLALSKCKRTQEKGPTIHGEYLKTTDGWACYNVTAA